MSVPPDIYQHIALMSDDRTILNMLSVNKKFNDPDFFKRIVVNRYPLTIQYKKDNENWKEFYIRMVYYINKAKEEYGFPYIPDWRINPEEVYKKLIKDNTILSFGNIWGEGLRYAIYLDRLDLVKEIVENGREYLMIKDKSLAISYAGNKGNFEMIEYLLANLDYHNINNLLTSLAEGKHINLLNYYLDRVNGNIDYNSIMEAAAYNGHINIVKLMLDKADKFNTALYNAAKKGYLDIVKLLIHRSTNLNHALEGAAKNGHLEIVKYLVDYKNRK